MKGQGVRLFDVLILGPAMVVGGAQLAKRTRGKWLGRFIAVAGVTTIGYNWRNYLLARIPGRR